MPRFRPSADLEMHYQVDDFTDPWRHPQTILMLHGNAESGLAWYAWVPRLARSYHVVRPDMRGFGQSSAMPANHAWTLDELTADFCGLMDHLGIERFHLVGAKIGGTIALGVCRAAAEAADHLDRRGHAAAIPGWRRRAGA